MIIANWKMQKTYNEATKWIQFHQAELTDLKKTTKTDLVLCPSFDSLSIISSLIVKTGIKLGAQNCATEIQGALTGEVSAISLRDLGCTYCIIGHSERRNILKETDEEIRQKFNVLLNSNIKPILCIGEKLKEKEAGLALDILKQQLDSVIVDKLNQEIVIAYEPVWAIGTGVIPKIDDLAQVIKWIEKFLSEKNIKSYKILYGGSVTDKNALDLLSIRQIDGFLLGSSSLDIQMLKKIVLLYNNAKYN